MINLRIDKPEDDCKIVDIRLHKEQDGSVSLIASLDNSDENNKRG